MMIAMMSYEHYFNVLKAVLKAAGYSVNRRLVVVNHPLLSKRFKKNPFEVEIKYAHLV